MRERSVPTHARGTQTITSQQGTMATACDETHTNINLLLPITRKLQNFGVKNKKLCMVVIYHSVIFCREMN